MPLFLDKLLEIVRSYPLQVEEDAPRLPMMAIPALDVVYDRKEGSHPREAAVGTEGADGVARGVPVAVAVLDAPTY